MRKTRFTLFALLLLCVVGCNEGFEPEAELRNPATENQTNVNVAPAEVVHYSKECASQILGYKENYYKLEHMRAAYSNLMGTTRAESDEIIEPTHCHYKFIPKDAAELTLLEDCPDLELFAYPLDAIVSEGEYFDSENPLWRYAVVPIDKVLPDVERELLFEMFIPDDSRTRMPTRCSHIDTELADRLVDEAMRITGNEEEPVNKTRARKWYGRGYIFGYDDVIDWYVPLKGVKVRITRAGVTHTAMTDSLGHFQMTDGFKYGAEYSIIWERADWDIRDGATGQAYYKTDEKVTDKSWILNIKGGKSQNYAAIHRAVYRHCYGENLGFLRCHEALRLFDRAIKISHMDKSKDGTAGFFTIIGSEVISDIRIFRYDEDGIAYTTPRLIKTTHHELGHAAHCYYSDNDAQFNSGTDDMITEGWAEFVGYMLAMKEYADCDRVEYYTYGGYLGAVEILQETLYPSLTLSYYNVWNKQESWPSLNNETIEYSPLFIDLHDDNNQSYKTIDGITSFWSNFPNDIVTGYTIPVLCNIILQSYSIHSLKTALRANKPAGVTDADIDTLFELYENNWIY